MGMNPLKHLAFYPHSYAFISNPNVPEYRAKPMTWNVLILLDAFCDPQWPHGDHELEIE